MQERSFVIFEEEVDGQVAEVRKASEGANDVEAVDTGHEGIPVRRVFDLVDAIPAGAVADEILEIDI